jgi:hypothetical protein
MMPVDVLRENGVFVHELQDALIDGDRGLRHVPGLLKRVIQEHRWQERTFGAMDRVITFRSFAEFVSETPPEGLGADLSLVKRLCGDDPEAIDLIDQATQNPSSLHVDNNVNSRPVGNTAQQAIRRLRKDRPDLHARVLAGELSPHAAMVEAGFRPRTITVPLDPEKMARAIRRRLNDDEIDTLVAALEEAD